MTAPRQLKAPGLGSPEVLNVMRAVAAIEAELSRVDQPLRSLSQVERARVSALHRRRADLLGLPRD